MEILAGTHDHLESCLQIAVGLPSYFTDAAIESMRADLSEHEFTVAVESGDVVGFISTILRYETSAEISWMAVERDYWGKGVGEQLVDYAAARLGSSDVKLLQVKTLSEEAEYAPYDRTRAFYRKMGFLPLQTIDPYPGWDPGMPCLLLVKVL